MSQEKSWGGGRGTFCEEQTCSTKNPSVGTKDGGASVYRLYTDTSSSSPTVLEALVHWTADLIRGRWKIGKTIRQNYPPTKSVSIELTLWINPPPGHMGALCVCENWEFYGRQLQNGEKTWAVDFTFFTLFFSFWHRIDLFLFLYYICTSKLLLTFYFQMFYCSKVLWRK